MADRVVINQLSITTLQKLQEIIRWYDGIPKESPGFVNPQVPFGAWHVRLFRTQGPAGTPSESNYPAQNDGEGCELPGRLIEVIHDETQADPVFHELLEEDAIERCSSWQGWIPRLITFPVARISGLWVPICVPNIPVHINASVTAPNTVEVEIEDYGIADTQTFTAHLRRMAGTSTGANNDDAFTWLNPRLKRWEIIERACA